VLPASILLDVSTHRVENPSDARFQIASQMAQFVAKIAPSYQNQFRSFALNRPRVRRNLCHAAVEWDNIQADAEEIDGYLQTLTNERPLPFGAGEELSHSFSLSSWIYHYKLLQLRLIVQMGFELSIYAPAEYADMYFYLGHLSGLHLSHLERISFFISQAQPLPTWTMQDHKKHSNRSLRLLYREFAWLKATDTLASALHRVFIVLKRHGHFPNTSAAYASEELRHELRMRPFQSLSVPEPMSNAELRHLSDLSSLSDKEILEHAARLSLTSRRTWEEIVKEKWHFEPLDHGEGETDSVLDVQWMKGVKNSMKACIGTSIAITTLTKALAEHTSGRSKDDILTGLKVTVPGPDDADRFHRWWAVPKISR
jgi:N-alpha-acetyltransferase 35, NatC auxiliary subunit